MKRSIEASTKENPPKEAICQEPIARQTSSNSNQIQFFNEIERHFHDALNLENKKLLTDAKLLIPLEKLQLKAMEKMRFIQK